MARITICLLAALSLLWAVSLPPAFGQCVGSCVGQCDWNYYWVGGSGDWFVDQSWDHEEKDPNQVCVPGHPGVPGGGNCAVVCSGSIYIASPGATSVTLDLDGYLDVLPGGSYLGTWLSVGRDGAGSLTQTGGTINLAEQLLVGYSPSASGSYTLDAGSLSAYGASVGMSGTGELRQTGGFVDLAAWLNVGGWYQGPPGGSGSYSLEALEEEGLSADGLNIAIGPDSYGSFTHTSGYCTVRDLMILAMDTGSEGSYTLSGGELSADSAIIGQLGLGEMTHTGGTFDVVGGGLTLGSSDGGIGTYALGGDGVLMTTDVDHIGFYGEGTFTQSGGDYSAGGLFLGRYTPSSHGTYTLSNGSLSAWQLTVGFEGNGEFYHTGGTNTIDFILAIGGNSSDCCEYAVGLYHLSGDPETTRLSVTDMEHVGVAGTGTFTQTGGTNEARGLGIGGMDEASGGTGTYSHSGGQATFDEAVIVGKGSNGNGIYELSDSAGLSAEYVLVGEFGSGTFVHTGGTSTIAQGLNVATRPGSDGTYELSGNGFLSAYSEQIGAVGNGTFRQTGGTNYVVNRPEVGGQVGGSSGTGAYIHSGGVASFGGLALGLNSNANGQYELSETAQLSTTDHVNVGESGQGTFVQSGGTASMGWFELGRESGATGFYDLEGGKLNTAGPDHIGASGQGTFTQSGGIYSATEIHLARNTPSSRGTYVLNAGDLSALRETIGFEGEGTFSQTGGTNTIADFLTLAYQAGSSGQYQLNGGSLSVGSNAWVGQEGTGTFTQSGGTNTVTDCMILGDGATGDGTYGLSGNGQLSVSCVMVGWAGTGTFTQTGGTNTITDGELRLGGEPGADGSYDLQGGVLTTTYVDHVGFYGQGTFAQSGGTYSAGEIILARVTAASYGAFTLSAGDLSASGVTVGYQGEGTFNQTGGVNTISGSLMVGGNPDGGAGASGNYQLSGSAELSAQSEKVGWAGTGTFTQAGGTNTISDWLAVGCDAASQGTYELSAGTLSSSALSVGYQGNGAFTHTGGTNVTTGLSVGGADGGVNAVGSYDLGGDAELSAEFEFVGQDGTGTLTHNGGTNTVAGQLIIGWSPGSHGAYQLGTATLSADTETIGQGGVGTFTQTGGTNTIAEQLTLGVDAGSDGTYELSGDGYLHITNTVGLGEVIGSAGTGTFVQTGGTHEVWGGPWVGGGVDGTGVGTYMHSGGVATFGGLAIGRNPDGDGWYELSGSADLLSGDETVGEWGLGTFVHSGGINTITDELYIGWYAGSDGTYELSDGTLSVDGNARIGWEGVGIFRQSGGTFTVGGIGSGIGLGGLPGSDGRLELSGGTLFASSWMAVGEGGTGTLIVSGSSASLQAPYLEVGYQTGTGTFDIQDSEAGIATRTLALGAHCSFIAVPGATVRIITGGGSFQNHSTDEAALAGLENLNLVCDGDPIYLEVAGYDDGPNSPYCTNNFVIDTLTVSANTAVVLLDDVDNGNRGGPYCSNEALYVNALEMGPDSILYCPGVNVYENCELVCPGCSGGGGPGGKLCPFSDNGDFDRDCDVDFDDLGLFIQVLLGIDTDPGHIMTADVNDDGFANGNDVQPFVVCLLNGGCL